jgi:hypothetical protein
VNYIYQCLTRMVMFLIIAGGMGSVLYAPLSSAFQNNIPLNTTILGILTFGIGLIFYRLYTLGQEQKWLDCYERGENRFPQTPVPKILLPLSHSLGTRQKNHVFSPLELQALMSGVDGRLEETRTATRYLTGLLIFLGLLGTFWGLSQTIGSITGVITTLDVGIGEIKDSFQNLKNGLEGPLKGMGTAFSSSLFGLAGSLILGFLDMQVGKAAGSFYNMLEERLTLLVKTPDSLNSNVTYSGSSYVQGLLQQTAEGMTQLQAVMQRSEENRSTVVQCVQMVGEKITMLAEQMISQQALLKKMAQGQVDLCKQLEHISSLSDVSSFANANEGIKQYLRNLDATTLRLLEELIEGRQQGIQELKGEIRLVARTISSLAEQEAA